MQSGEHGRKPPGEAGGEPTGADAGGQADGGAGASPGDGPDPKRLLALLRELVARDGRVKAAETLGVSFRTLQQADDTGELTPRMEDALKGRLLEDGGVAGAQAAGRLQALERRQERLEAALKELAKELGAQLARVSGELAELRAAASDGERGDEPAGSGEERERVAGHGAERTPALAVPGVEPVIGRRPATQPWRAHPELVTLEPEEGEELVYGDAAPLIAEWRRSRAGFLDGRNSRVERATGWVRMCELAITLISEHELTLPLADYPWDRFERRRELQRSEQSLRDARRERRRALCWRFLRRVVTFGMRRR